MMNINAMNNTVLNTFDMARILKFQSTNTGVYGLKVKSVFPTIDGEEEEWSVTPAHGDGKEGIALLRNVYDSDTEMWWREPAIFLWFPAGYIVHGSRAYEIISRTPVNDPEKLAGTCAKVGGARNLPTFADCTWDMIFNLYMEGLGLFNKSENVCCIFTFPEGWAWRDGIPYHA